MRQVVMLLRRPATQVGVESLVEAPPAGESPEKYSPGFGLRPSRFGGSYSIAKP
jgi:hypothetical protein